MAAEKPEDFQIAPKPILYSNWDHMERLLRLISATDEPARKQKDELAVKCVRFNV